MGNQKIVICPNNPGKSTFKSEAELIAWQERFSRTIEKGLKKLPKSIRLRPYPRYSR